MLDVVRIRSDDYQADIYLNALPSMSVQQFRKVLRLLVDPRNYYGEDFAALGAYLQNQYHASQEALQTAENAFATGYQKVNYPRSRRLEVVRALQKNRRLQRELQTAKRAFASWDLLLKNYNSFKEKIL